MQIFVKKAGQTITLNVEEGDTIDIDNVPVGRIQIFVKTLKHRKIPLYVKASSILHIEGLLEVCDKDDDGHSTIEDEEDQDTSDLDVETSNSIDNVKTLTGETITLDATASDTIDNIDLGAITLDADASDTVDQRVTAASDLREQAAEHSFCLLELPPDP